ncbi:anthrone oxygenase family protein [Gordonia sp. CPCC 206044]|uniref:anthrone oxygenase family protein n=1 Tax=Gordonia sp. CPCC 206044 TaxID=3140793 RepID=UPI003AF33902
MSSFRDTVLVLAVTTVGLAAGLFAAFAYAVMPGLRQAGATSAVAAMQRINVAILNPVFALVFVGALVFGVVATALWWGDGLRWWLVAAVALYAVALLITAGLNVPLNNRLDAAGAVTGTQAVAAWADFIGPWVQWNIVRAVASTAAFVVALVGVLQTRG